jgi:cytochrome c oxidase assembly protein subunit 15
MKRAVKVWLLLGLFLVFMQIFIGGVTRLTGSGLSITKWEIVTGTLPPLNEAQWQEEFNLYKETPQYEKINEGMSLSQFKFIYFWEYFHRLWARMMGFIFLFPFLYFLRKGWIGPNLRKRLLILVGLAAVVAVFGWIMVASGLNDRPWVSAYKLTWHLSLALIVFSYLAWLVFSAWYPKLHIGTQWRSPVLIMLGFLIVQIMLGGIMSGAKAGISYPTWPDMRGEWIPSILFDTSYWKVSSFIAYDENAFFPALIQTLHRLTAYVLFFIGIWVGAKFLRSASTIAKTAGMVMMSVLSLQVILGIWTVVECRGIIPVGLGVAHQSTAVFLLTSVLWLMYLTRRPQTIGQ